MPGAIGTNLFSHIESGYWSETYVDYLVLAKGKNLSGTHLLFFYVKYWTSIVAFIPCVHLFLWVFSLCNETNQIFPQPLQLISGN